MNDFRDNLIEVAVCMPAEGSFTYGVPAALRCRAGMRVLVPFGRQRATGYVLGPGTAPQQKDVKAIFAVLDESPLFPEAMIPLFRWTSEYYKYPLGAVIQTALPGGLTLSEATRWILTPEGRARLTQDRLDPGEARILGLLAEKGLRPRELRARLGPDDPYSVVGALERRGYVRHVKTLRAGGAKALQERWVRRATGDPASGVLSPKKRALLEIVAAAGALPVRDLAGRMPNAGIHLRGLERSGYVEVFARRLYRDPFGEAIHPDVPPELTVDQKTVVGAVGSALGQGFRAFLLKGVTGSGKTEVYLRVASQAMASGMSVVVLVPEIALITQTERRFRARFGDDVAVLHSGLSEGERFDQWTRILRREVRIAIGARSAVFAPFSDVGAMIVDEEHDSSYKQEGGLHYSARDLAVVRAQQCGAVALLGSATPSLQSYHNVRSGKYTELTLPTRIEARPLPEVRTVDLRRCRDLRGPGKFISAELNQALADTLRRGEQTLLFLNRRGFASFPVCAACGATLRCRHCDISLTLHREADTYRCHYCGFSLPGASGCGACGSKQIKRLGMGTEKVESAVRALFPEARVARMDRDTTGRKGDILRLLKGLREKTIDILVGTQMVTQGHDFPGITLVGIVCADLSLSFPDFRAGERTFQLLSQVAGRAGRGDRPGQVILQTYHPEHFSIRTARDQDFDAFYRQEIEFRKALGYPPITRLVQLRLSGRDARRVREQAEALGAQCQTLQTADSAFIESIQILGPIEAPLARIAGQFRWQILVKSPQAGSLHRFVDRLLAARPASLTRQRVRMIVDVDPLFLL
jgi:primosomal protein N' (replication factor Y)